MPKNRAARAQIFQSFDALKGFREIIKEQERIIVPKKILSEDDFEVLNWKVHQIKEQMIVRVTYYDKGEYVKVIGKVSKINLDTKVIQVVKKKIQLSDIVDIELDSR